jgi:hypothetical protein
MTAQLPIKFQELLQVTISMFCDCAFVAPLFAACSAKSSTKKKKKKKKKKKFTCWWRAPRDFRG